MLTPNSCIPQLQTTGEMSMPHYSQAQTTSSSTKIHTREHRHKPTSNLLHLTLHQSPLTLQTRPLGEPTPPYPLIIYQSSLTSTQEVTSDSNPATKHSRTTKRPTGTNSQRKLNFLF